LYSGTDAPVRAPRDVLLPAAIKKQFHDWIGELLSMGVMVHSKVVVLDPFGAHPVLMTGSHNMGAKASRSNDDNLVILEGEGARAAAIAYAVNIIAIYQEYRWRAYVAASAAQSDAWHCLQNNATWQDGYLAGANAEEFRFWSKGSEIAVQQSRVSATKMSSTSPAALAKMVPRKRNTAPSEGPTA
jgi:phosphatidylserine/phosphatidylglycerophosphate/cardiolipin synthase-like enzyme